MDSIQLKLPFPPEEQWRDIPGWEGWYQVSNTGYVRSIKGHNRHIRSDKILAGFISRGYRYVSLCRPGKTVARTVHLLVLLAFVGERPQNMDINHKNGIKTDNRLENLEYCTHRENMLHAANLLNYHLRGANNSRATLTESQVTEIRHLRSENGLTLRQLSDMYHVTMNTISLIARRKIWRHLPE